MKGVIYIPATRTTKYEIYLMNVPFNSTYNDVILFESVSARNSAFISLAESDGYHYSNLNIIVKNSSFILAGRWDKFNECNYMMWRYSDDYGTDNDHTSKWFFSFIDDVKYNTRLGTVIKHSLDVWQTYHLYAKFNKDVMIERGMVKPADDTFGRWLAPEPFTTPASVETSSDIFTGLSFAPELVADTLSKPTEYQGEVYENDIYFDGRLCEYDYGGVGDGYSDTKLTGIYRFGVYLVKDFFDLFNLPEKFVGTNPNSNKKLAIPVYQQSSHLTDILKMTFIPAFVHSNSTREVLYNANGTAVADYITENELIEEDEYVEINRASGNLACGYNPHNVKMYTSLCNAYKIYNRNGLSIPLKVELINRTTWEDSHHVEQSGYRIGIKLSMNNHSNTMKLSILDYKSTNRYFDIPYSYDIAFGYNSNTGVAHASREMQLLNQDYMRKYNGYMPMVNSATELITGAGALTVGGYGAYSDMQPSYIFAGNQSFNVGGSGNLTDISQGNMASMGAGIGLIGKGFSDLAKAEYNMRELNFNYSQAVVDTYASIGISIGSSSTSRTNMQEKFWKLRLAKCSPLYDECVQIEDFLDRYGYTIKELQKLRYFIRSRKYWNFVKTNDCQISIPSPTTDNVIFNKIFNNGVTIWKNNTGDSDFNVFRDLGNYSFNNYSASPDAVNL